MHDEFVACASCFLNEGLRRTAWAVGTQVDAPCRRCGSTTAPKLTVDTATELFRSFFCEGSKSAIYSFAPFLLRPTGSDASTPASFDGETTADYSMLVELTHQSLSHYAGRGATIHYRSLIDEVHHRIQPPSPMVSNGMVEYEDRTADELFDELLDPVPRIEMARGTKVYRARKEPAHPTSEREFDSPPEGVQPPGRFNPAGMRVFYGALDIQTCLAELKLTPEEVAHNVVVVATLEFAVALKLLDLGDAQISKAEEIWNTLFLLTLPHEHDYFMSQALSRHIAARGFAGFLTPTAMRFSMQDRYARNIILFGSPLADHHLRLTSLNRVNVIGVHYDLQFGPVWAED